MPDTAEPSVDSSLEALLQQGLAKSGVLWLGPTPEEARPAWFAHVDPHAYVLTGEGEQRLPPLEDEAVLVLRSKETRGRILVVPARVERLTPQDPRWDAATAALAKARLNGAALPAELPDKWARTATVFALSPDLTRAHR